MSKSGSLISNLVPSTTVFISSGCIMVLEITAGRLLARYLGSSLHTWTSVIGVVLAGIAIGNYLGGRIADRYPARKTLAVLFAVSSVACVGIIVLNTTVGNWEFLWRLSWPVRVFCHVSSVFLIPSTLLGMISPVVAKMALDRGLATGRTIGAIYAWGAAGSIAGTFLAGFYLIAVMGTIPIFWTIGGCLLLMAILYWPKCRPLYPWAMIFAASVGIGPFAGTLALIFFSMAIMAKLLSETVDAVDPRPIEAARATGSHHWPAIRASVWPQVLPNYVAYALYIFEINIRASVVLGIVGAGGIGRVLEAQRSFFFFDRVMAIVLVIFVIVFLIEQVSVALRRRLV